MFFYKEQKLLPYSCEKLFSIVKDIEKYPEFIPWCKNIEILERKRNSVTAKVTIGNKLIEDFYICKVHFVKNKSISITNVSGILSLLKAEWRFKPKSKKSCIVEIEIEFSFKSKLFNKAMMHGFDYVAKQITNAFEKRAKQLNQHFLLPA